MASTKARVYLHGRFPAGARVTLYEVPDEATNVHIGFEAVDVQVVDEDQRVEFVKGVKAGGYYLIFGYRNGQPLTIRARGKVDGDQESVIAQPPVKGDPQTFAITGRRREAGDVAGAAAVMEAVRIGSLPVEEGGLKGQALHERAAELDIEGRSSMSADELRAAITAKEAQAEVEGEKSDAEAAQS